MSPMQARRGAKRYRYYVTRFMPGDDKAKPWRLPAGEIERLVIGGVVEYLQGGCEQASDQPGQSAQQIEAAGNAHKDLASALLAMPMAEQRALLLDWRVKVQMHEGHFALEMCDPGRANEAGSTTLTIPAKLVDRGSDLKLVLPPGNDDGCSKPDPVLLKLVAQAYAAQDMILNDTHRPTVEQYGKRHLAQLLRISWLAPDIISAIVDGRQPKGLTGRKLLRATNIPLDWVGQRVMFGFA